MNVKKIAAAFAAAAMLGVSLTLTPAAIDDNTDTQQEVTAYADDAGNPAESYYGRGHLTAEEYAALTNAQKSEYFLLLLDPGAIVTIGDINTGERISIPDGNYVWKRMEYMWIGLYPETYEEYDIFVNREKYNVVLNGDGSAYGSNYYIADYPYDRLTVGIGFSGWTISAEEYNAMPALKKSHFAKTTVSDNAYFIINNTDLYEKGTYYVLKNITLYIAALTESCVGHDILVNGEKLDLSASSENEENYGAYYDVPQTGELNISMRERELTDREKADFVRTSIDSKAYILKDLNQWYDGYDEYFIYLDDGDYARKGDWYYIGALTNDYIGNDIYLNGQKLDVTMSGDRSNYGAAYQVKDTDTELTVTLVKKPADSTGNTGNAGSTGRPSGRPGNSSSGGSSGAAPAPAPSAAGSSSSTPAAASSIRRAAKTNISVNAPSDGITADILSAFSSNSLAKKLTVKYSSTLQVEISKENVNGKVVDLDFTNSGNFLTSKKIKSISQLKNCQKAVQLNFDNDGDFGGVDKVGIKSYVGKNLKGKTAVVYEYKNGKLVKTASGKISAAGKLSFNIDHYGQYVIAVK